MDNLSIIHRQADDFLNRTEAPSIHNYKDFINDVRCELTDYNKEIYKLQFIERLMFRYKTNIEKHMEKCDKENCVENQITEHILFFLQEEHEEIKGDMDEEYFDSPSKQNANQALEEILEKLNKLELGQEIIWDDLSKEFEDLREYYFLKKKNWVEMLTGKLATMIVAGIINETVSKEILEAIKESYPELIQ